MANTSKALLIVVATMFAGILHADEQITEAGLPKGALTGASVFVSPGHGWWFTDGKWTTQRGNNHGVVEDLSNAETVIQYLVPYLENAGARVYLTRERDMQTNMVIVEAEDARLDGEWTKRQNPGAHGGTDYIAAPSQSARAIFTPEIPGEGYYAVYAWYAPKPGDQVAERARITVHHSGGPKIFYQNQNHDTHTWKYLGTYHFEQGASSSVAIESTDTASAVADAVRFGGGMGDFVAGDGTTSGRPRWEESGLYYVQFAGFDAENGTRSFNQVRAMPRYSEWEAEPWEKDRAIYVSWHTNGSLDHLSTGISTYIYGIYAWGPPSDFTGYPGGEELARYLHNNVLDDVRAHWDSEWEDVGIICRWLGETNPESNFKMPAVLIENGFHDNAHDASYILDPQFRRLSAAAAYKGIVEYFANEVEGFDIETIAPETPLNLHVRKVAMNQVEISWQPPQGATSYRVFRSKNGKGFDEGIAVTENRLTLKEILPNRTEFVRVVAVNEGGWSWPSETLAVRPAELRESDDVLIVNGFDRLDREMNLIDTNVIPGERVERGILSNMNSRNYIIQHANALHAAGWHFDSCSNDAVINGDITLADYRIIVWILGNETSDDTFTDIEQKIMRDYLAQGGNLFISGANVARDLGGDANPAGEFLGNTLRAEFRADNAKSNAFYGANGSVFDGLKLTSFGPAASPTYPVNSADIISPANGSRVALFYQGNNQPAAIQYEKSSDEPDAGNHRLIYLAFPFETIEDENVREEIILRAMAFLNGE